MFIRKDGSRFENSWNYTYFLFLYAYLYIRKDWIRDTHQSKKKSTKTPAARRNVLSEKDGGEIKQSWMNADSTNQRRNRDGRWKEKEKKGNRTLGRKRTRKNKDGSGWMKFLLGARHVPYLSIPIINNMKTISTLLYVIWICTTSI